MEEKRKRLGEILIEMGVLSDDQLTTALRIQREQKSFLGQTLVQLEYVVESDITIALAKQNSIPYISLPSVEISSSVLKLFEGEYCLNHQFIPIDKIGSFISIVFTDPTRLDLLEEIKEKTQFNVQPFVGIQTEINAAILRHYQLKPDNKMD